MIFRRGGAEPPVEVDILTVCTGNFCRSPIAEALLQEQLGDLLRIASAGTLGMKEHQPHPFALEAMRAVNMNPKTLARLRPRKISKGDIRGARLILTAEAEHRRRVIELDPTAASRTFTLREFDGLIRSILPEFEAQKHEMAAKSPQQRLRWLIERADARLREDWHSGKAGSVDPDHEDIADPLNHPIEAFTVCLGEIQSTLGWISLVRPASSP